VNTSTDERIYVFQIQIRSKILFQNPIQIEDDLNASEDSAKTEGLLMIKKKQF